MELILNRGHDSGKSTIGILSVLDGPFYAALEDAHRDIKVKGITRVPAGRYPIKYRRVLSNKTKSYRAKFNWFTWHLELQNIPGFKYVYIHIGNTAKDTNGCILVAQQIINTTPDTIINSTPAFRQLYGLISDALDKNELVFITIKD